MKKIIIYTMSIILVVFLGINTSQACTDFRIIAKDGTVLIARSMEFAANLKSNLLTSPRGRNFYMHAPNGKSGASWKSRYGYVYLDGFNLDMPVDGMNEQGLSYEALYLPGETTYQTIPAGQENRALPY